MRERGRSPMRLRTTSFLMRLYPRGIPGRVRLGKLLLGDCRKARNISLSGPGGLTFLVPSLQEPIALHLSIDAEYEPATLRLLLRLLTPGSTFVDVGANIGVFGLP